MNKISRFFKNKSGGDDFSVSENFTTINDNVSFAVREAYKTLRTNVIFSLPAAEGRVIGVTSANKGEGKSTSSINLALSIAETGKRVLFLDCDLRLSHIAERLKPVSYTHLKNTGRFRQQKTHPAGKLYGD